MTGPVSGARSRSIRSFSKALTAQPWPVSPTCRKLTAGLWPIMSTAWRSALLTVRSVSAYGSLTRRSKRAVPNLQTLTGTSEAQLATVIGAEKARPVLAYLRSHPEALNQRAAGDTLSIAREKIAATVEAYKAGDRQRAGDLALAAYLDGFEPLEPVLSARDGALMRRIEQGMADLRSTVGRDAGVPAVVASAERANGLLDLAERALSATTTSAGAAFAGSFTVLLREGLEALLIVVAILAFLKKAGRPEVAVYVHGGWLSALAGWGTDLGGCDLSRVDQWGQPRTDGRLRLAVCGPGADLCRHLDARQKPGRRMAGLYPREDVQGAQPSLRLVPVSSRVRRRLSRSLRDDSLSRRLVEPGGTRRPIGWAFSPPHSHSG